MRRPEGEGLLPPPAPSTGSVLLRGLPTSPRTEREVLAKVTRRLTSPM